MLDIKFIRENRKEVEKSVKDRGLSKTVDIKGLLELDEKHRDLLSRSEQKRALRNNLSKAVSETKDKKDKEKFIKEATQIKEDLKQLEDEQEKLKSEMDKILFLVPNVFSQDVPEGKDESENKVIREWGTPAEFDFEPKDHVDLGKDLDLIDTETSAKVSGSRFNYLKNEAVLIQFGLIQYVLDTLRDKNIIGMIAEKVGNKFNTPFIPVVPPVIIKAEVAKKMDRYDPIEDRYYYENDDVLFVGSAEHSVGSMHMDQVLESENLPLRYIGYSTAFRREAGTYGKDTRGIIRRHQFDKLEMESFSTPEQGLLEQDLIVAIQEYMVQQLKIPYQVIILCTGDMGKPDYRQIDINCWMPGQGTYRETHTSDYMTDFQARRLNTRYKKDGKIKDYVHMNDATAFAIGRILVAILENYQQKDGSVIIPEILHSYTKIKKIEPKK